MKNRLFIRSLSVLVLSITTACICLFLPKTEVSSDTGVVLNLPEVIGPYSSYVTGMSEKEKEWLPETTSSIKRMYYYSGEQVYSKSRIDFSIVLSGGDERSLHRPAVCLDAQGWIILQKSERRLLHAGRELLVTDLSLTRNDDGETVRAHYYYFWVGRGINTPRYSDMKWLNLWDNFTKNKNHRWAYPGIMVTVDETQELPHKESWQRASYILKEALPYFHKQFGAAPLSKSL